MGRNLGSSLNFNIQNEARRTPKAFGAVRWQATKKPIPERSFFCGRSVQKHLSYSMSISRTRFCWRMIST